MSYGISSNHNHFTGKKNPIKNVKKKKAKKKQNSHKNKYKDW